MLVQEAFFNGAIVVDVEEQLSRGRLHRSAQEVSDFDQPPLRDVSYVIEANRCGLITQLLKEHPRLTAGLEMHRASRVRRLLLCRATVGCM